MRHYACCLSQFFIYFRCTFFFAQCFPPKNSDGNSRNGDETLMTSNICVRVSGNFSVFAFFRLFCRKKALGSTRKSLIWFFPRNSRESKSKMLFHACLSFLYPSPPPPPTDTEKE